MKTFIAGLTFGLAIGVIAVWIAQGQHSGTLKQEPMKVTVIEADCKDDDGEYTDEFDPDLCIEEDKLQMVDVFKIGLMDFVLPAAGGLTAVSGLLIFLAARSRRDPQAS